MLILLFKKKLYQNLNPELLKSVVNEVMTSLKHSAKCGNILDSVCSAHFEGSLEVCTLDFIADV